MPIEVKSIVWLYFFIDFFHPNGMSLEYLINMHLVMRDNELSP